MFIAAQGEGPTVVLVHGIPGAGATWAPVADRLAARGHRVLVPDLLGFGRSPRPPSIGALWADAQAAALLGALDERGVDRFALAGHDLGGPVAAHVLARAPERVTHLAVSATNAFGDTPIPLPIRAVTWPGAAGALAARVLFGDVSLRILARMTGARDAGAALGDRAQRRAIATIFGHALREMPARYAPVEAALRAVRVPALVAWGDRDPFFGLAQARRTAALIPGARLVVYEGCGHGVPEHRPDELARDLAELVAMPAATQPARA